jgi:hypothetical protein
LSTSQVASIVAVTHAYDRIEIVHCDLKRRNLLHKQGYDIRVGDHGFTGFLKTALEYGKLYPGKRLTNVPITHPKIGYPRELGKWSHRFPTHLWVYLNRWQMYFDFVYNRKTFVFETGSTAIYPMPEPLIRRLLNVPLEIVHEFDRMIRSELERNPDRKFVPKLPPLPGPEKTPVNNKKPQDKPRREKQ